MAPDSALCPRRRALLRRSARTLLACATGLLTAGCGGGVWLGFSDDDFFDDGAPAVSITASPSIVRAGDSVRLVAAASDGNGIDSVAFFRFDGASAVLLGAVGSPPYEWVATVPNDGRTSFSVFARATDNTGRRSDSDVFVFTVVP